MENQIIIEEMHYSPGPPWPAECGAGFVNRTYEIEKVTCLKCLHLLKEEEKKITD